MVIRPRSVLIRKLIIYTYLSFVKLSPRDWLISIAIVAALLSLLAMLVSFVF